MNILYSYVLSTYHFLVFVPTCTSTYSVCTGTNIFEEFRPGCQDSSLRWYHIWFHVAQGSRCASSSSLQVGQVSRNKKSLEPIRVSRNIQVLLLNIIKMDCDTTKLCSAQYNHGVRVSSYWDWIHLPTSIAFKLLKQKKLASGILPPWHIPSYDHIYSVYTAISHALSYGVIYRVYVVIYFPQNSVLSIHRHILFQKVYDVIYRVYRV